MVLEKFILTMIHQFHRNPAPGDIAPEFLVILFQKG
jgi:hypothetical protein